MHIKIYRCCTPLYMDLHTEDFGLRLSTTEIVFLNLYNILHNRILIANIVITMKVILQMKMFRNKTP